LIDELIALAIEFEAKWPLSINIGLDHRQIVDKIDDRHGNGRVRCGGGSADVRRRPNHRRPKGDGKNSDQLSE